MKHFSKLISLAWTGFFLSTALMALPAAAATFTAGDPTGALDQTSSVVTSLNSNGDQLFTTIGNLVNVVLGLLGIVFFGLLLFAGWKWMTAQGDTTKVGEATTMITQAVIGLIIILSAFAISNFALTQLIQASGGTAS